MTMMEKAYDAVDARTDQVLDRIDENADEIENLLNAIRKDVQMAREFRQLNKLPGEEP